MREIYFDNSATTKPYDDVINIMQDIQKYTYGNPSSLHRKGIEAEKFIKEARQTIAKTIKCSQEEIIFTSGGTEANNIALFGYLKANKRKGRHVITSKIEHASIMEPFKNLEINGYKVDYVNVDSNGLIDLNEIEEKISEETALVSIMLVNNETGAIQPVEQLFKLRRKKGLDFAIHTDAVQAYGKMEIGLNSLQVDLMSLSAHKVHGPKGTGALYIKKGTKILPLTTGGGHENGLRSGTENTAGIAGFGAAAQIMNKNMKINYEKVKNINKKLRNLIKEDFEYAKINSNEDALPYILNVSFGRLKSEVLLHHLEEKGIYVSTGSACSSHKNSKSHVLKAMGIDNTGIDSALRISFSEMNDESEINILVKELKEILPKISY